MYVSIETQNKMYTYKIDGGRINPDIAFRAETLAEPRNRRSRQAAGTVHVHPNGRFLYGANRAQDTVEYQGKKVFKGGENSIVVYAIDQSTGEPTPIQHIETRAIHPRTFHIDPSGRMLVAQHNLPVDVTGRPGRSGPSRPACRCSVLATTASSPLCASTTSTSAARPCSGWACCSCSARSRQVTAQTRAAENPPVTSRYSRRRRTAACRSRRRRRQKRET